MTGPGGERAAFWVSDAGVPVWYARIGDTSSWLVRMSRDGMRLERVGQEQRYFSLRLSPDGKRVAVERLDRRYDDLASGKVKLIPGDEVIARLRAKSAAHRASRDENV